MIRGASLADTALLMVDASNIDEEADKCDKDHKGENGDKDLDGCSLEQTIAGPAKERRKGHQARRAGIAWQHALIARALGCKQIIVVVNKMDNRRSPNAGEAAAAAPYVTQARYLEIVRKARNMLVKVGWPPEVVDNEVAFIPISALYSDNITKLSENNNMPWWQGVDVRCKDGSSTHVSTLLDVFDKVILTRHDSATASAVAADSDIATTTATTITAAAVGATTVNSVTTTAAAAAAAATASVSSPSTDFRMSVYQTFRIRGVGFVLVGRVEQGVLRVGDEVLLMHCNEYPYSYRVRTMESFYESVHVAHAGDIIGVNLAHLALPSSSTGFALALQGQKYTNSLAPITQLKQFTAQVQMVSNNPVQMKVGFISTVFVRTMRAPAALKAIVWKAGRDTGGQKLFDSPGFLRMNDLAEVVFEIQEIFPTKSPSAANMNMELYDGECKPFGRVVFIDASQVVMVSFH